MTMTDIMPGDTPCDEIGAIRVSMIVALDENRVIGRENQLPWRLPGDLRYFKARTLGKPVVMGRKTYESIGKPLPGRCNIVITRQSGWQAEGVLVANTVEEALDLARQKAQASAVEEVMVIGGEQIYVACLPLADRLYITQVHAEVEGDAWFPALPPEEWEQESKEFCSAEEGAYAYSFVVYGRKAC